MEANCRGHRNIDDAIILINKIRHHFRNRPGKYDKFLEILHLFQQEIKSGSPRIDKRSPEAALCTAVSKLFNNRKLSNEFKEYLLGGTSQLPVSRKRANGRSSASLKGKYCRQEEEDNNNTTAMPNKNKSSAEKRPKLHPSPAASSLEENDPTTTEEDDPTAPSSPNLARVKARSSTGIANECRIIGVSYRAVDKGEELPRCSARTKLCREVLNDDWVSFSSQRRSGTWTNPSDNKYKDKLSKCEDGQFELDLLLEYNASAIRKLEYIEKKMSYMTEKQKEDFILDEDSLSRFDLEVIQLIYGEKASPEILKGLEFAPYIAVPLVLIRLKSKEREWREAKKECTKVWRETKEKYYLKSLDFLGIRFKKIDLKAFGSKALLKEIVSRNNSPPMVLTYPDKSRIFQDAADLILHNVEKHNDISEENKASFEKILRTQLPYRAHRSERLGAINGSSCLKGSRSKNESTEEEEGEKESLNSNCDEKSKGDMPDNGFNLFYGNNTWYLFLRLHHTICERLAKMDDHSVKMKKEDPPDSCFFDPTRCYFEQHWPDRYAEMLHLIESKMDSSIKSSEFEEQLRKMFGIHAYNAFTLAKIVSSAARQLKSLASDEVCCEMWDMYRKMGSRPQDEASYRQLAYGALSGSPQDGFYKICMYKENLKITIKKIKKKKSKDKDNKTDNQRSKMNK